MRHALYIERFPAVLVRFLDQERACGRGWLGRWLSTRDHRANVIGRSKASPDIATLSAHGPLGNQLRRIHPSKRRPAERGDFSSPLCPSVSIERYPPHEAVQSLERAFSVPPGGRTSQRRSSLTSACGCARRAGRTRGTQGLLNGQRGSDGRRSWSLKGEHTRASRRPVGRATVDLSRELPAGGGFWLRTSC